MGTVQYADICAANANFERFNNPYATGYGRKIRTSWKVQRRGICGWYTVYAMHYSNVSSFYIVVKGKELFVDEYELDRLPKVLQPCKQ